MKNKYTDDVIARDDVLSMTATADYNTVYVEQRIGPYFHICVAALGHDGDPKQVAEEYFQMIHEEQSARAAA